MTIETLLIMATVGAVTGAAGGAIASNYGGMIIGGSAGLVLGSTIWTVLAIVAQTRRERRLDRHFQQQSRDWE